jgi:hypothetical protein
MSKDFEALLSHDLVSNAALLFLLTLPLTTCTGMDYSVHFRDVRLWSNAALFAAKMRKAQAVVNAITTHGLLDPADFDILLRSQVSSHLRGFPKDVDTPDLAQLSTLLDESWLGERVIDSRAHILMTHTNSTSNAHTLLFLPCFFKTQLSNAYRNREFTKVLTELRDYVLTNPPKYIAFIHNKNGIHWAPCIISLSDRIIYEGDSLGWSLEDSLPAMLEWVFRDVAPIQGAWTTGSLDVPQQPAGSGSCGVVALCSIAAFLSPQDPSVRWHPDSAADIRLDWIAQIIRFHCAGQRERVSIFHLASLVC